MDKKRMGIPPDDMPINKRGKRARKPGTGPRAKVGKCIGLNSKSESLLRHRSYLSEEPKPGQFFVMVDISIPGGKLLRKKIYDRSDLKRIDRVVDIMKQKGRNVQVIDALWYKPARELLQTIGIDGRSNKNGNQ